MHLGIKYYLIVDFTLLLGLQLIVQQASSSGIVSVMQVVSKCPSPTNLDQLPSFSNVKHVEICIVTCHQSDSCHAVYYSSVESVCYHGNTDQWAAYWNHNTDNCISYIKDKSDMQAATEVPNSPSSTVTPEPTTTTQASNIPGLSAGLASKLLIFFDFRQSFTNLADPTKFSATPFGGVVRDSQGAWFPGNTPDYIEVDTASNTLVTENLDYSNNFTFYARIIRQAWSHQNYHYFHNCSGNLRAEFADHNGMLWSSHAFSSQASLVETTETVQSVASNLVTNDNTPMHVSAAAVYTGIHFNKFYFNGTTTAASSDLNYAFQGLPVCLRLGYHTAVNHPLRGRFICYAIAKAALSAIEVVELGNYCAV